VERLPLDVVRVAERVQSCPWPRVHIDEGLFPLLPTRRSETRKQRPRLTRNGPFQRPHVHGSRLYLGRPLQNPAVAQEPLCDNPAMQAKSYAIELREITLYSRNIRCDELLKSCCASPGPRRTNSADPPHREDRSCLELSALGTCSVEPFL
jgi:hypothetical protein